MTVGTILALYVFFTRRAIQLHKKKELDDLILELVEEGSRIIDDSASVTFDKLDFQHNDQAFRPSFDLTGDMVQVDPLSKFHTDQERRVTKALNKWRNRNEH